MARRVGRPPAAGRQSLGSPPREDRTPVRRRPRIYSVMSSLPGGAIAGLERGLGHRGGWRGGPRRRCPAGGPGGPWTGQTSLLRCQLQWPHAPIVARPHSCSPDQKRELAEVGDRGLRATGSGIVTACRYRQSRSGRSPRVASWRTPMGSSRRGDGTRSCGCSMSVSARPKPPSGWAGCRTSRPCGRGWKACCRPRPCSVSRSSRRPGVWRWPTARRVTPSVRCTTRSLRSWAPRPMS
jgi:hypothetical protein